MTLTLTPLQEPFIWSLRANWDAPNGLYYNPINGGMFSLTDDPYVCYMGRVPSNYLKETND